MTIFAVPEHKMTNMDLKNGTYYLGVDDNETELFENQYPIPEGISYNSYLIIDDKVAVMDTVDCVKSEEWKANLEKALDGRTPDYLVVHHMEPDHSALIGWAMEQYPGLTVVASAKAIQMMPQFFEGISLEGRTLAVKEGDQLSLGNHVLRFFTAPMVHWPEVIVSADMTDGVLYSADAFGKFGALGRCGDKASADADWITEARRYYFNIVGKYGAPVQTLLGKLSNLQINEIRPLHGPVIDADVTRYVEIYDGWSKYQPDVQGVLVAYASIHGGTAVAAKTLADMLRSSGKSVELLDICHNALSDSVGKAFSYPVMVLASSSYDAGLFTPMHDFLYRLQIKGYSNRRVAVIENGSWAPSAARVMKEMLGTMKNIEIIEPTVTIRSRMKQADKETLRILAEAVD